jgi:4-hydroxybenzoate polyprenyltransferase
MNHQEHGPVPLYVDLDGTILGTDLLWESVFLLIRYNPLMALRMPQWFLKGRANLKSQIASQVTLDVGSLPYRPEVIAFLKEQKRIGRPIVMATASHESFARAVASHLKIFDDLIASTGEVNVKGKVKRDHIVAHSGGAPFDYIGDSHADHPIWASARKSLVVCTARKSWQYEENGKAYRIIIRPGIQLRDCIRALRPHQWAKNSLLALPLIASHRLLETDLLLNLFIAIMAFSLLASSMYVVNDLLDLQADRRHYTKRKRPFASGAVPIPIGIGIVAGLLITAAGLTLLLPTNFGLLLLLYSICTMTYSLVLKKKLLVDVICLAGLYTLRVMAGGEAVGVGVSDWLLAFLLFFFLSLALAKRYAELIRSDAAPATRVSSRGYQVGDSDLVRSMGMSCGLLAVLVFCLYIHSGPEMTHLYNHPRILWLMFPLILYWIARVWFLASRGQLTEDPVVFALRDRISLTTAGVAVVIMFVASY